MNVSDISLVPPPSGDARSPSIVLRLGALFFFSCVNLFFGFFSCVLMIGSCCCQRRAENMAEDIKDKLENYRTAPFDARFPNQNQTRNCWSNYLGEYSSQGQRTFHTFLIVLNETKTFSHHYTRARRFVLRILNNYIALCTCVWGCYCPLQTQVCGPLNLGLDLISWRL